MRQLGSLALITLLVGIGCSGDDTSEADGGGPVADAAPAEQAADPGTTAASGTESKEVSEPDDATGQSTGTPREPTVDLAERPQIWFGPQPPLGPNEFGFDRAGPEFYDLFHDDAPWSDAARKVHVVHFFGEWVAWRSSADELRQVIADLNRRGVAIAYEAGPLTPIEGCTEDIEGFAGSREGRMIATRVARAGGRITYMSLEHPFDALSHLVGTCRLSLTDAAADIGDYMETVRDVFPDIEFGLIETGDLDVDTIAAYLDTYQDVLGELPTHLMLDVPYGEPGWPLAALEIEDYVHSRGIDFAIFYLGFDHDQGDREWLDHARQRIVEYEVIYGGRPDRPIFESWHPYPQTLLPDTDPSAFTEILNWYGRPRTSISVDAATDDAGLVVTGRLTDATGSPLAGETVTIAIGDRGGLAIAADRIVSGVVPEGATQADVGWRINEESIVTDRAADLVVERVAYRGSDGENLVRNPEFADGVDGWIVWGDGQQSPDADGLHVRASPGQVASANSERFAVTPGATFEATFSARVSEESDASGHFAVIFHGESGEVRRVREHIRPSRAEVGQAVTDVDGEFELALEPVAFPWLLEARYDGSDTRWPARAVTTEVTS